MAKKFTLVKEYARNAKGIAWDTCHKIYVLMDDETIDKFREYEYDEIVTLEDGATPEEMAKTIKEWYRNSCGLKFVQAVSTNHEDPNKGYEVLIGQGE
jgi:hypothetical protein